jgi:hypothetical protein
LTKKVTRHPIQPLQMEGEVLRFKRNKIVEKLLETSSLDLNDIACMGFSEEDRLQLNQLIGYSHSGIPGCNEEVWQSALAVYEQGVSEAEARANHLREELDALKAGMRKAVARLYGVHVDDLKGNT